MAEISVTVHAAQAGAKEERMITDKEGAFAGIMPLGRCVVEVLGQGQEVTVIAGEVTQVQVNITADHGILLTAEWDDHTAFDGSASCAYRDGQQHGSVGVRLKAGLFWFPLVPPAATEFGVIVTTPGEGWDRRVAQQAWPLEAGQPLRKLTLTVPHGFPIKLKIVRPAGQSAGRSTGQRHLQYLALSS